MGFAKFAKAGLVKPAINMAAWDDIRAKQSPFPKQAASKVVLQDYDPSEFLLSHCTIIASVDTEDAGLPTGRQMYEGHQIDRPYSDFFITPDTSKYVNNNNDSWERKLLLSSFRSFIDGENYVEHIQIPALSKGKIIDAAARDLGDTVYVDILVATHKKHAALVEAITSKKLNAMSMGAQVEFTICSKCGNVASDELQLCNHIKYFKGSEFIDGLGKRRKIAELCGHIQAEPGSVRFIEASWVANPAFTGAVLRNIISTDDLSPEMKGRISVALTKPAREVDPTLLQKAARRVMSDFRLGEDQAQFPGADDGKEQGKDGGPLDKAVDDLYGEIKNKLVERVRKDLNKGDAADVRKIIDENQNESLIKSACRRDPSWVKKAERVLKAVGRPSAARKILAGLILLEEGGWGAVKAARRFSGREILVIDRMASNLSGKKSSIAGESRIYATVVAVGGTTPFANVHDYLAACRRVAGRDLTASEQELLVLKGKLFALGL